MGANAREALTSKYSNAPPKEINRNGGVVNNVFVAAKMLLELEGRELITNPVVVSS